MKGRPIIMFLAIVALSNAIMLANAEEQVPIHQATDQEVDRAIKACTFGSHREQSVDVGLKVLKKRIISGEGGVSSDSAPALIPQLSTSDALQAFLKTQDCIRSYLTPTQRTPGGGPGVESHRLFPPLDPATMAENFVREMHDPSIEMTALPQKMNLPFCELGGIIWPQDLQTKLIVWREEKNRFSQKLASDQARIFVKAAEIQDVDDYLYLGVYKRQNANAKIEAARMCQQRGVLVRGDKIVWVKISFSNRPGAADFDILIDGNTGLVKGIFA